MTVVPYKEDHAGKKVQVAKMFDNISGNYDFLNHFLSLGIVRFWRKKAIGELKGIRPKRMLDVATGTGDFAIDALTLNPDKLIEIDISDVILAVVRKTIVRLGVSASIEVRKA